MKPIIYSIAACILIMGSLSGCGVKKKQNDVWDNYDVRHPVPQASQVPDGYARQYDQYIDNDEYYQQPDCSVMDSPSCGGD